MNKTNHPSAFIPYPSYKDSGVAWLGDVPKYWEMRKFRTILTPIAERNRPDLPLLSVVREKGVIERNIKDDSENYNYIPDDLSNYKIVKSGQFAMNKMKAWQGSYGISKFHGIVSPAYFVFDLKCIEPGFFHKAVRSRAYVPFFTQASDGVRVGQWDLSQTRMKEMPFFIPSSEEQLAIARFLDYKTAQIARFIKAKKRMIELLKEQKQVIINDAVTGKIVIKDEGGRLKAEKRPDSSFIPHPSSFLQTVPEGWEVRPIKQIVFFNPSKSETGSSSKSSENVVFLPMENVSVDGRINCSIKRPYKDVCNGFSYFKKGDVVIAKITPCFENGKGAYLDELETECGFGTTEFITIRPSSKIDGRLLRFILSSNWFLKIGEKYMMGSAGQKRISSDFIKNFQLGIPSLEEQAQIVSYIETKTAALDQAISRTEREIALMQEYRTRLISDVVTGKIDVQNIEIPDIANIDATIDESIDEPEGEEELETAEAEE